MWESSGWILPTVLYAPRFAGWDDVGDTLCPIARSLSVIGDRWTMLLIRELLFGTKRFDEFQAQTGMSSHLLSTLLTRLEEEGVVKRTPYQDRPVRYDYRLTEKGKDLFPVILSLRGWGNEWCGLKTSQKPAVRMVHTGCGGEVGADPTCTTCGERLTPKNVSSSFSKLFARERTHRNTSFGLEKRCETTQTSFGFTWLSAAHHAHLRLDL